MKERGGAGGRKTKLEDRAESCASDFMAPWCAHAQTSPHLGPGDLFVKMSRSLVGQTQDPIASRTRRQPAIVDEGWEHILSQVGK